MNRLTNQIAGNSLFSSEIILIISYPTRAIGIIVLLKRAKKQSKLNLKKKLKRLKKITHTLTILFVVHGIMTAKPMKTLELHYPIIQFLIISDIQT